MPAWLPSSQKPVHEAARKVIRVFEKTSSRTRQKSDYIGRFVTRSNVNSPGPPPGCISFRRPGPATFRLGFSAVCGSGVPGCRWCPGRGLWWVGGSRAPPQAAGRGQSRAPPQCRSLAGSRSPRTEPAKGGAAVLVSPSRSTEILPQKKSGGLSPNPPQSGKEARTPREKTQRGRTWEKGENHRRAPGPTLPEFIES